MTTTKCGCVAKTKRDRFVCSRCRNVFCAKHIFIRVDESNSSITNNAPQYCADCYRIAYGSA